jgi:hypothetical protein
MKPTLKSAVKVALLGGFALSAATASATNKELLETLYENGGINKAQYEKLLKNDAGQVKNMAPMNADFMKKLEWASRIKMKGDVRFRWENVNAGDIKKDRERIRARLAFLAKVNDEVDTEIRIATGTGDRRSTNQTLGGSFDNKELWLDRAYIDWHPDWAYGTHAYLGKIKQVWYKEADMVWDNDINPEGVALKYSHQFADTGLEMTAVGGYYILVDSVDGEGNVYQFSGDMDMFHVGLSGHMMFNDTLSGNLGFNTYLYDDEDGNNNAGSSLSDGNLGGKGNSSQQKFSVYETAASLLIKTDWLPIKLYGQYAFNSEARSGEDTGWLIGANTKWKGFKLDYNYRYMEKNFAPGVFIDSDFNGGNTAAKGHKLKLAYTISKNFSVGAAYFAAQRFENTAPDARNYDTFQMDLKAKF